MPSMTMEPRKVLGLPHRVRNELVAVLAEFAGTFLFLFFSYAAAQAVANTAAPDASPNASSLLFTACGFGCSLAVAVWIFYRVSGGMLNPAVTLALVLAGAVSPLRGLLVLPAQLVGSIAAAALASGLLPGPLTVAVKLGPGVSTVQGLFIEVFLTIELVIAVLMLAVEKHRATFLAPLGIGLALFVTQLVGLSTTGAAVNPARAFGTGVVAGFNGYDWIYWVGPLVGSLVAWGVWRGMVALAYGSVNKGQDDDGLRREDGLVNGVGEV